MGLAKLATGLYNNMDTKSGKYLLGGVAAGAGAGAVAGGSGENGGIMKGIMGGIAGAAAGSMAISGAFRGLGALSKGGVSAVDNTASAAASKVGPVRGTGVGRVSTKERRGKR